MSNYWLVIFQYHCYDLCPIPSGYTVVWSQDRPDYFADTELVLGPFNSEDQAEDFFMEITVFDPFPRYATFDEMLAAA